MPTGEQAPGLLAADTVASLRTTLTRAGFCVDTIQARLGETAHEALLRNETTPAFRQTSDRSPLSTLVRLWSLQRPVPVEDADRALDGLVAPLAAAGFVEVSGAEVRARLDVRPYADDDHDWWVVSDLTPGLDGGGSRVRADHVLGVSSASTSLAQLTLREPVGRALDLGTGSGVQALHLSTHAGTVVATDLNPRCLTLAATTAALSGIDVDLRHGDLYGPVQGETFDLITSNPPYVLSPGTGRRLLYRDSGLPGDEVVRRTVVEGAAHLAPDGWCQILANWPHVRGTSWRERVSGWVRGTGCDAWVVQREVSDVPSYVELWLRDAGLFGTTAYLSAYDEWLDWFAAHDIDAVGYGWLMVHRTDHERPWVRTEEWAYPVRPPLAPHVRRWGDAVNLLRGASDADLLATRFRRVPGLIEERSGNPGDSDPAAVVLRQTAGLCRARQVDTVVAGGVGACDGELSLAQISDALAQLLDRSPTEVRRGLVATVRELVEEGYLQT